ncbi:MAG: porphobilinogen synthase, partial [Loktanella sp.]|nr:porphobilinogen synthase [Loktanella sp.]
MKPTVPSFPAMRLRRMRQSPALRSLVSQNSLSPSDLIWPIFVMDGTDTETPIASMPGVTRKTVDRAVIAAREAHA